MSERISIKGKGADLFFGGDDVPRAEQAPKDLRATQPGDSPPGTSAALPPSHPATMPPSAQMEKHEPSSADPDATTLRRLRDVIGEEHSLHYSYRFTRLEIDFMRDAVYELEVKHGVPATRNDVVRLGLNWLMDDYRTRGKQSVLVQVLKRERWKPTG